MCVVCMSLCVPHAHSCLQSPEEDIRPTAETRVTGGCEKSNVGCREMNSGPPQVQYVSLTTKPSF